LNLLDAAGLKENSWLPYIDVKPDYNEDTQYITGETVINTDDVTMNYTINDYTENEMVIRVTVAKSSILSDLYTNVKKFISNQPSGWPRYDNDLKLNIMNASMIAISTSNEKPANCVLVETWIYTVQTAFFALKTNIAAATTLAELNEIDVSYDWFEDRYGREGTIAADPGISTDDLFT